MKRKQLIIALALLTVMLAAVNVPASSDEDRILGVWITPEKDSIRIYKTGGRFFGKPLVLPGQKQRLDVNNPDPVKRNRSLADVMILEDFIYENGIWAKGRIYDPKNGKTYSCTIKLQSDKEMIIRGYVGISLFGRSETWTRPAANP